MAPRVEYTNNINDLNNLDSQNFTYDINNAANINNMHHIMVNFKIVLTCSHKPFTEEEKKQNKALYRRMKVIPFI